MLKADRHVQTPAEDLAYWGVTPRQMRGETNDFTLGIQKAREGQAHGLDIMGCGQVVHAAHDVIFECLRFPGRGDACRIHNLSGGINHRGPQVGSTNIEPDGEAAVATVSGGSVFKHD